MDVLRSVEFLAVLPPAEVERFMVLGRCADHPRRHVFWRAADEPTHLVVAVSGEAMTTTRSADGRQVIHGFMGPGACVGLAGVLDGLPRPHDAEVTREGEFFAIRREDLLAFLDRNPRARRAAVTMLGRMYRRSLRDLDDVVFLRAAQRVARFFIEHACVRQTDGARVLVDATLAQLASRTGMVPEVASRLMARLRRAGLVRRQGRAMFVADWAGLRALAGPEIELGGAAAAHVARSRTDRFFLPMAHARHGRPLREEAATCRAALGDLALCRERGCPAALDDAEGGPDPRGGAGGRV